jgi:predicted nucleotidyltransferase
MEEPPYPTLELSRRIGVQWSNIEAARTFSRETLAHLEGALADSESDDTSVVVLGSLGREEFTSGSDIDWNLLVDGIADPNHHALFLDVQKKIREVATKSVGREGTFDAFVSSHDLIHRIGGEHDTNRNLTRRLLLLLESSPIGRSTAHGRVVKNVLKRYLLEDRSFWRGTTGHGHHIPHFLLNDIARFWRTMAVDFAYKLRTRSGDGWAIRNIKLRMSRKLLYVSGLVACFRCHLFFPEEIRESAFGDEDLRLEVVDVVDAIFSAKPLDIVAILGIEYEHLYSTLSQLFGAYDEFLGILRDEGHRKHLETLAEGSGEHDPLYRQARTMSHRFRDAILAMLFDEESELGLLTRLYGVV